jgi:RNA polymerase sigma-B factor
MLVNPTDERRLFGVYHQTRDRAARAALVARFLPLARYLAWRYHHGGGEPLDDLVQVASIGLLKAIDRFDPERGVPFPGFATPTITGELKRHFRDHSWAVRVPRGLQELALRVNRINGQLERELGRPPTTAELAARAEAPIEDVLDAWQALRAQRGVPLDAPPIDGDEPNPRAKPMIAREDGFRRVEDVVVLERLLTELDQRDREILRLRYWDDLTQAAIAERIGLSQMQVSRLIRRVIAQLQQAAALAP